MFNILTKKNIAKNKIWKTVEKKNHIILLFITLKWRTFLYLMSYPFLKSSCCSDALILWRWEQRCKNENKQKTSLIKDIQKQLYITNRSLELSSTLMLRNCLWSDVMIMSNRFEGRWWCKTVLMEKKCFFYLFGIFVRINFKFRGVQLFSILKNWLFTF